MTTIAEPDFAGWLDPMDYVSIGCLGSAAILGWCALISAVITSW